MFAEQYGEGQGDGYDDAHGELGDSVFSPPTVRPAALVARGSWCAPADLDLPVITVPRPRPTELPVVECRRGLLDLMDDLGWSLPDNAWDSIARFRGEGLDDAAMGWLIAVSHSRSEVPLEAKFRYFCGCCWRTIRGEL